jgi:autotransporter-associated beta strand protein
MAFPALAATCGTFTCDVVVTIHANNTVSVDTSAYGSGDGEDPAILVINNSSTTVQSIVVSGTPGNGSFYDDNDGLYGGGPNGNTYETALATFAMSTSNSNDNSGTVNFTNGLSTGQSTYFSLESLNSAFNVQTLTSPSIPGLSYNISQHPIDTNQSYYLATGLSANTLIPVFDGGTLRLDGTPLGSYTFTIDAKGGTIDLAGNTATLSNPIADDSQGVPGSLSVVNSGSGGSLVLTAGNTYTGSTTVGSGATLSLTGNGSIASSSGLADNGTFDISGANGDRSLTSLSGSGQVNLGGNSLILTHASGSFGGVMSGTGGFTVQGGSEALGGNNTYSGATTIGSGATLSLTGNGSIASSSGLADNGTFDISGANGDRSLTSLSGSGQVNLGGNSLILTQASGSFSGSLSGNGGVTLQGGNEVFSGNNSYSGGTTLAGGTLKVGADNNLGASNGALNFNGGTLENTGSFVMNRSITTGSGATFYTDAGTTLTDTTGTLTGSGTLTKQGTGTLILGVDGGSGGLQVNAGNLFLTGASSDNGAVSIASGATLSLTGNGAIASASGLADNGTFDISGANGNRSVTTVSGNGQVNLGGNSLTLSNATGTFSGSINGSGGLVLGGGTMNLAGQNGYTGGTTLDAGTTLSVAASGRLGGGVLSVGTGATMLFNNASQVIGGLTGSGTVTLNGTALTTNGDNRSTTFSGVLSGNGSLSKDGSGTLTLTGNNTFSGGTTINGGAQTVTITPGASELLTTANVTDGADITVGGTGATVHTSMIAIGSAGNLGSGSLTLNGGTLQAWADLSMPTAITLSAGSGAVDNNGHTVQLAGSIDGSGALTLVGNGITSLSGTNTYAGGTTLGGGTVSIASAANLGSGGLAFNGYGVINNGGHTDLFTGTISGDGGVVFAGTGTTNLTGNNSYSAGSFLFQGTVAIASAHNLGTGAVNLYGGSLRTTASVNFNTTINTVASGMLDNAGHDDILAGGMAGSGTLTLSGNGSFKITGTHNGTGTVNVSAGTTLDLTGTGNQLTVNQAANDGTVQLGSGAILTANGSFANHGLLYGTGGLLEGNLDNTGGTFDVGPAPFGPFAGGASPVNVTTVATVPAFANFGQATVSDVSMVHGNFTQDANGTLVFGITPTTNTQLLVTGNVVLDGTLDVQASTGKYLRTTYTLINGTHGSAKLSGQFSNVQVSGLPQNWGYDLTYVTNPEVLLSVYPLQAFSSAGKGTSTSTSNSNVTTVGHVFDGQVPTASGNLYVQLDRLYLLPSTQLTGAIQQIDGEIYADAPGMMAWVGDDAWHPVYTRMGLSATEHQADTSTGARVWMSGLGSTGNVSGTDSASGLHRNLNGILMGTDADNGRWNMGVTLGSVHAYAARQTVSSNRLDATLWQAGGYASTPFGTHGRFGVLLGYSTGHMHFTNDTVLGRATGRAPASMFTAQLRGSWTVDLGDSRSLTPIVSVNGVSMHLGRVREQGLGTLSLIAPKQQTQAVNTREQFRFNNAWQTEGLAWNFTTSLGLQQILVQPDHSLRLHYAGIGDGFMIDGVQASQNSILFDAGMSVRLGSRTSMEIGYRGTFAKRTRENAIQGKFVVKF